MSTDERIFNLVRKIYGDGQRELKTWCQKIRLQSLPTKKSTKGEPGKGETTILFSITFGALRGVRRKKTVGRNDDES